MFEEGDWVIVARRFQNYSMASCWVDGMDSYIGKVYQISIVTPAMRNQPAYAMLNCENQFGFPLEALEYTDNDGEE